MLCKHVCIICLCVFCSDVSWTGRQQSEAWTQSVQRLLSLQNASGWHVPLQLQVTIHVFKPVCDILQYYHHTPGRQNFWMMCCYLVSLVPVSPLRLHPPHLQYNNVAPSTLLDLHLYRGSYSHLPLSWPTTAPQTTLLPLAPPTSATFHRPIKASSLLCHILPSALPVCRSMQNKGKIKKKSIYIHTRTRAV